MAAKNRLTAKTVAHPHLLPARGEKERSVRGAGMETLMRRKVTAPDWRFPLRLTRKQWSVLPYRYRHAYVAQAQCTLLGYWRDCKNARCRRARRCLFPDPCYWDRKRAMSGAEWAKAEAACRPLRELLSFGSLKGSEGLWLF
jgi:hypothetical protein